MANRYELAEGGDESLKVKGMFYYGVVKVKGKDPYLHQFREWQ